MPRSSDNMIARAESLGITLTATARRILKTHDTIYIKDAVDITGVRRSSILRAAQKQTLPAKLKPWAGLSLYQVKVKDLLDWYEKTMPARKETSNADRA